MLTDGELEDMRRSFVMGGLSKDQIEKLLASHVEALKLVEELRIGGGNGALPEVAY